MPLSVTPVSGALGAVVYDVDPRTLDDATLAEVVDTLHEYEVIFLPRVDLSEDEHLAFARRLGTCSPFPLSKLRGVTEPTFQVITDGPDSLPEADDWHTDVTWTAQPPKYALLHAAIVPARGGDTLWASATTAYDALSPAMQEFVSGLHVLHDGESFIAGMYRKNGRNEATDAFAAALREQYPPVVHPLVRTHPDTGRRALMLGGRFMRRIEELIPTESHAMLEFLAQHIADVRYHCRWRWSPGDLAIWDERSTCHRSAADHWPQARSIRRIEVDGDTPYFDPAAVARPRRDDNVPVAPNDFR